MTDQAPVTYAGPPRVLSGVQPSGALHLGNYLGALVKFTRLQHEIDTFIFVADLHAITVWQDPAALAQQTREIAAAYIASGLDPDKATIFPQSAVREHAELSWIFNCVARLGWLDRMTQFKEKSGKHKERSSVGLYTYPVLQAADILIYKATHVPVGEDQKQHLELTRDIAQKFNHDFNAPGFFPLPDPLIQGPGARVMSLRDGSAKMSKSDPSDYSRINLTDTADDIAAKVKKARTDPEPLPETIEELATRAEADNLVGIFAALAGKTKAEVLADYAGKGFGTFKPALAELAVESLAPVGERMRGLLGDPAVLDAILAKGAEKAREAAAPTLAEVKKLVGFWGA
ncbi:tryptophan--tRNA ligase [Caulobacter vibrioides]|uniref:Tryptophan--tRNA ligase n=2 Tax=Caulobacter vibrioides TaxID=155892 RepID=SYW_CAUVC|nr:tryptophan--tRNA ligase [Caulobacter vibrioides]YP_002515437.1 tryptophanyl-tRNA synthetase [Caulobacter vibrioides NA1000]Q9AC05.1 RecName: Full=Tryptophan--tRNA ligase; AltName: Full=Tryptophanyl-tRNA synthetase; Short=TrpRS [Caulobacter vibrioides CB15]QBQ56839.1 tryptophan--tRNA ligase [synthetic Caulobacter sp. 'ethensis']AAK22051.1 tryptophanyl-tRNA synthetase [Caulobacter vibrioides CB15]ACL93529.1 tryptophanyl-tRNA synthetase [Caulobacter vibrioides NA1000]ATC23081.1 tryptophan--tR